MAGRNTTLTRRAYKALEEYRRRFTVEWGRRFRAPLQDRVFFLHIPKCGGTSLVQGIRNGYLSLDPGNDRIIGGLDHAAAERATTLLKRHPLDFNRELLLYYLSSNVYRFVSGHFTFDETAYREYGEKFAFVTMLRDPVRKWLSLYFYNRYKKSDHYKLTDDLDTFVESQTAVGYGRDYVMQFAREHPGSDDATPEAIEVAKRNLNRFRLVGLLEHLDRFGEDFEARLGVRPKFGTLRKNPASSSFREALVTEELRRKIHDLCRPNYEIYDHVLGEILGLEVPGRSFGISHTPSVSLPG